MQRRIGVLGGAFDPPHRAHVALARAAIEQLSLDLLWVVPTGEAWHKVRKLSSAQHRLAMTRLAFRDLPQVRVTELELHRSGPSYTADTLEELQGQVAMSTGKAEWYLLMGADQVAVFHTWKRHEDILKRVRLAVARRKAENADAQDALQALPWPVTLLEMPIDPISSTFVRDRLTHADSTPVDQPILDEAVAGYIAQHNLYQNTK